MDAAPAYSRNASSNTFPGNDFSNNIFTDLAPLLTLFGDQMTKQFLSMSMGWADNALIAICPIGILTVMVSAIRIAGASRLKTFIGRARESRATAELELLSATSGEVCEMWSGSEIVRVAGQPSTIQYILNKTVSPLTVMTLSEALKQNIYLQSNEPTDLENWNAVPNLTINVQNAISVSWQLLTLVAIGICIQLTAFVLSAVIVFGWSWSAGSEMLSSYGFPCYLIGTVLLSFGLLGCARVIQNSSKVEELSPNSRVEYQPLFVQRACIVDDKHFLPYAIFQPEGRSVIKVSRSNGCDYSLLTFFSTVVALLGYICQFVGLRAMHWSVALIQLLATLTMTCARAFVRRGLANQPICYPLPMGTDATGLAYLFSGISAWELSTLSYLEDTNPEFYTTSSSDFTETTAVDPNPSNSLIMIARSIGVSVPTAHPTSLLAQQLVNTILAIMELYSRRQAEGCLNGERFDCDEHCWEIQPLLRMPEGQINRVPKKTVLCSSLTARKAGVSKAAQENSAIMAFPETFSAILSLWLAVLVRRYSLDGTSALNDNETAQRPLYHRIIGNDIVPQGVPQGKAIGKWLSSNTTLYTINLRPDERQMKNGPIFGAQFSSRHLRFKAVNDQYRIPVDETIADAVEPNALPFSDPSVSWTGAMRTLGQRDYLHPLYPDEDECFSFLRGLTLREQRAALRRTFQDGSTNRSTEVAVLSTSSLERTCALELFTLFMLSLTSKISLVKSCTTRVSGPNGETWTNDVISEMAGAVVQTGLAEDEAEALTLVVPAFAARGLLPTELS